MRAELYKKLRAKNNAESEVNYILLVNSVKLFENKYCDSRKHTSK